SGSASAGMGGSSSASTATVVPSGSGGGTFCGGEAGDQCPPDQYCDFQEKFCGGNDTGGTCQPRPVGCDTTDCPGVCACDGKLYCNLCAANAAGFDIASPNNCMANSCDVKSTALGAMLGKTEPCTVVIRLDDALTMQGYQLFCGGQPGITEMEAKAKAQMDTG